MINASLAEQTGLPDDEGKLIVARYEEEGTRSKLGPNLAVVAGLVKQKAASERPPRGIRAVAANGRLQAQP